MTEIYSNKSFLALFNLLDSKFEKTKDPELGRLLRDMNPNLFVDDTSADSTCFEYFSYCCAPYPSDEVRSAFKASIDFLKMYDKNLDLRYRNNSMPNTSTTLMNHGKNETPVEPFS